MELKTCECGAYQGYMLFINKYGNNYEVACINCGRKTALKATRQQAINGWNNMKTPVR
jgi:hypothetical protein